MQSGFLDTVSGNELWGGLINLSIFWQHCKDCFSKWWMNRCPVCRCVTGWKDWKHSSIRLQTIGNGALKHHVNSSLISALRRGGEASCSLGRWRNRGLKLSKHEWYCKSRCNVYGHFPLTHSLTSEWKTFIHLRPKHLRPFFFLMLCRNCGPQAAKRKKERGKKKS